MKAYFRLIWLIIVIFPSLSTHRITLAGDNPYLGQIAWSSDGKYIAMGYENGMIIIRNVDTQKNEDMAIPFSENMGDIAWNDGTHTVAVAYYRNGQVFVWNVDTDESWVIDTLDDASIFAIKWGQDGKTLIVGRSIADARHTLQVFNATTGKLVMNVPAGDVISFSWSPSGDKLLCTLYNEVMVVLDTKNFEELQQIHIPNNTDQPRLTINSAIWSPDGRYIASGSIEGIVHILDYQTEQVILTLITNEVSEKSWFTSAIHALHFNDTGKFLSSVSADGSLWTWDISTGKIIDSQQLSFPLYAAEFSPNGYYLAYGGEDGLLHIIPSPFAPTADTLRIQVAKCITNNDLLTTLNAQIETEDWRAFNDTLAANGGTQLTPECVASLTEMADFLLAQAGH